MWPNPQFPADLVTFTEEILNRKFQFLCSDFLEFLSSIMQKNCYFNISKNSRARCTAFYYSYDYVSRCYCPHFKAKGSLPQIFLRGEVYEALKSLGEVWWLVSIKKALECYCESKNHTPVTIILYCYHIMRRFMYELPTG